MKHLKKQTKAASPKIYSSEYMKGWNKCHDQFTEALKERVKGLEEIFNKSEDCPDCNNVGWYPVSNLNQATGEYGQEQIQCQFCYTKENSVFNLLENIRNHILKGLKEIQ